jgi:hypothetical protein
MTVGKEEEDRIHEIENGGSSVPESKVLHDLAPPIAKSIARVALLKGVGTFLIGLAMICTAIVVWRLVDANEELRQENACRFDVSTEVNSIADRIDALTAEIFVEAIRNPSRPGEPNPEVVRLGQELEKQVRALEPAIEARQASTETCKRD